MPSSTDLDGAVRLHVYERFLEAGLPPTTEETAETLGITGEEAAASYRRLAEGRAIVLAPGTTNIWMANPLSATPTPFWVETSRGSYYGSCIWDAFGVVAMLGGSGAVLTQCPDCGEELRLTVTGGSPAKAEAVAHFSVPARRWWQNIGYA